MSSSGRTVQLGLWREIVSKRHDETQPVNNHLNFIQDRFQELESQGFVWSKESTLGIFLQLGLSEAAHGSFSSVTKILESRVHDQRSGFSSDEVKQVIQSEELRHKSRPLGLMDLPTEVFENILETLDCMARLEAKSIQSRKRKRRVKVSIPGDHEPYFTYSNHRSPILNSFQAFSLTSRGIYQLCRPWLWRRLEFPTSLPGSMDLWTKDILLRQGTCVRSLKLTLSINCSKSPNDFEDYPSLYDNLTTDPEDASQIEFLSPKNIKSLIKRCPNLSTLEIRFEHYDDINDFDGTENFLINLIPLLSSLKHLRHFSLEDRNDEQMYMYRFPSKLLSGLPLLESLTLDGSYGHSQRIDKDSFGFKLSKLKFLSRLDLVGFSDDIYVDWCLYDWPRTLTDLSICYSSFSSSSLGHQTIHHIAPHLTKLRLDSSDHDSWENFSLPFLNDLKLSTKKPDSLESFQDCVSIRRLHWSYGTLEHCQTLNRILSQSPWPQLTTLVVVPYFWVRYEPNGKHRDIEEQLVSLEKYCQQANLNLFIRRPGN
ncbi:uncharacterized protein MELLADRAFT_108016 [Melampsora larici-populina 98AG31]|uniref:Uncharacterized protein n=1 Tax=Melampsora larici-populina (strain 98AG31 / pathotype 3-4-7) TaxID=747676 RepID=F4RRP3_MELLP|nr:uncharacterized protein MELLADRAFT_108016 [Melampsora larici-populina 98AG31]EGG04987.1 hypothetical protein MELLADRAFT_108016 [Melampsora larici-populina 98AG31]